MTDKEKLDEYPKALSAVIYDGTRNDFGEMAKEVLDDSAYEEFDTERRSLIYEMARTSCTEDEEFCKRAKGEEWSSEKYVIEAHAGQYLSYARYKLKVLSLFIRALEQRQNSKGQL
jgi:hypothetical protein